jgi:hypothetical protein
MGPLARPRTGLWMGAAFTATLAVALAVVMTEGTGERGVGDGLRLTARVAYLLFWPAYIGGAIATLSGGGFGVLARSAREFGLAFASAMLVHVALVIWLAWISPPEPFLDTVMPFFAIGVIWTCLLAISSIDHVSQKFDPDLLRVFRTIGMEYIALTFFTDFVILPEHPLQHPMLYAPFWAMLGLGPLLRLAATLRRGYGRNPAPLDVMSPG